MPTCVTSPSRDCGGTEGLLHYWLDFYSFAKGAAGQAVQNMNPVFGAKECIGLSQVPVLH
mgnify:CR=1 FL=1